MRSVFLSSGRSIITVVGSPGLVGIIVRVRSAVNEGMNEVIVVTGSFTMTVPIGGVPCGGIVYVVGGPSPKTAVVTYEALGGT